MLKIKNEKLRKRFRIKKRIRSQVSGTATRPRLTVFRSNKNIYAQLIDDVNNVTLASVSDMKETGGTKMDSAKKIGSEIAKMAQDKKISAVVFDRNGYNYTGRIKMLADSAREAGLTF